MVFFFSQFGDVAKFGDQGASFLSLSLFFFSLQFVVSKILALFFFFFFLICNKNKRKFATKMFFPKNSFVFIKK